MQLEFDEHEKDVIAGAADVFARLAPIGRFRSDSGPSVWQALAHDGWGSLGAAVADGTLTLGLAGAITREAGRLALVEEFITSGFVLSSLVARVSADSRESFQKRLHMHPGVLTGDGRQPGLVDSTGSARSVAFGAEGAFDLYRISTKDGVAFSLSRVDSADRSRKLQTQRLTNLSWAVAEVETPHDGWCDARLEINATELARLEEHAMLLHSAALVGAAERLLEMTTEHVLTRKQFGRPIGQFQAVKHSLAEVYAGIEVVWSSLLCALADQGSDRRRTLAARILCVQSVMTCARAAAQFQGAFGFSWEADTHIYLKTLLVGSQRFCGLNALARQLGEDVVTKPC